MKCNVPCPFRYEYVVGAEFGIKCLLVGREIACLPATDLGHNVECVAVSPGARTELKHRIKDTVALLSQMLAELDKEAV